MKTILLADDSITIQKVVELTFSEGDYRVVCVGNGTQALRKASEIRPDIILLDVVMPEKNGYDVCAALRAETATARVPVLLLTGTFEPFDQKRADAAGASGHLTKPFESHTLVSRVEEMIARGGASAAPPAEKPRAAAATHPGGDAATDTGAVTIEEESADAFAPPGPPPVERRPAGPHPAFAAPDAATGGSYAGFANLEEPEEPAPDRREVAARGATVRISRDEILGLRPAAAPIPPAPDGTEDGGRMEGFLPGYELPEPMRPGRTREEALGTPPRDPAGAPPPPRPEPPLDAADPAGPANEAAAATLSDAALDRIAEMVVRKISERVVREIAWEVLPGVAESVVRQRIRELEDTTR